MCAKMCVAVGPKKKKHIKNAGGRVRFLPFPRISRWRPARRGDDRSLGNHASVVVVFISGKRARRPPEDTGARPDSRDPHDLTRRRSCCVDNDGPPLPYVCDTPTDLHGGLTHTHKGGDKYGTHAESA